MYLPAEIYVEVIVTMMQCVIKVFMFCSVALQLLSYSYS